MPAMKKKNTSLGRRGRRSPPPPRTAPAFVTPMAAQVVKRLPEGDEWLYELKFDGYRALVSKNHDRVEIRSRKNKDLTRMYPRVAAAGLKLNADQAVVDGEIVALDSQGRPSFQALQHRGSHLAHQVANYAFDLLHVDGAECADYCCVDDRYSGSWRTPGSMADFQQKRNKRAKIGCLIVVHRPMAAILQYNYLRVGN
jgi:bifunctional non-homologous end joining protein LigD